MKKDAVLVLLSNSLGEIHFILPYLRKLKSESNADVYFYFINARIYNKAVDDVFYHDQISAHAEILRPNDLFLFLLKNRKRVRLILKDTTPLTEQNIVFRIRKVCPDAMLVLFPHAYALLGYEEKPGVQGKTSAVEDSLVDKVLYVHPFDKPVLIERYAADKMLFAGALGYSSWWAGEVRKYVEQNHAKLDVKVDNSRTVVLFTLRDVHKTFLSEENFDYLFRAALEVLFQSTEYFVIIKPHPRQNIARLSEYLSNVDKNRYAISYLNTFVLAQLSDVCLSFWSSAVTDGLAMGIPSVEFHRFHTAFNQTVDDHGVLKSFYSHLNLTDAVSSKDELLKRFPSDKREIKSLYNHQHAALERVFSDTSLGFDNFKSLLHHGQKKQKVSLTNRAMTFTYFFLKFVFRKLKPV